MKRNQANAGEKRRLMYIENKDGEIDGAEARIGWVGFSKSGLSILYRGRTLSRAKGRGVRGNYFDAETGDEYWVSGVKKRGSNVHWAESLKVVVDEDARDAYAASRS
jgi:hypothetical protein